MTHVIREIHMDSLSHAERELDSLREMYQGIGFAGREAWRRAPAAVDGHSLQISGHPVMEDWEAPYMRRLAAIATGQGGHVLEVGFGMGIAATFVDVAEVDQHTIIEANHEVAAMARIFADEAQRETHVLEGFWEELIDEIPDGTVDGILFDAYPLTDSEIMNQAHFAPTAYRKLRSGGVFTYFSDEIGRFRERHLRFLMDAGFARSNISGEIVAVRPPVGCRYWKASTILAPAVTK